MDALGQPALHQVLASLVEDAPDAMLIADANGRYTYANTAASRLLGYSPDEFMGMDVSQLVLPEESARFHAATAWMRQGHSHVGEWMLRRRDGSLLPMEIHSWMLPDGQTHAVLRDISERRAHEAEHEALFVEMEAERKWLREVLHRLPLGVIVCQADGRLFTNSAADAIVGPLSATCGASPYARRVFRLDGTPVAAEDLPSRRALAGGDGRVGEQFLVEQPDGSRMPVMSSSSGIRDLQGRVLGSVTLVQDITQQTRDRQSIERKQRLLQAIFDLLPVGLLVCDRGGAVELANGAADRIWKGRRRGGLEEFAVLRGWYVETGEPVGPHDWALARALEQGATAEGELLRIECFDGSSKTIINWAAPLRDESGEITGAIALQEDVTALEAAREQLRATVRDREHMLAVVSHDLRNPLSGIVLAAAALQQLAQSLPGAQQVSALATTVVRDAARGMSGLVDDLLALAVQKEGRSMLSLARVSAETIVQNAAATARLHAAKASLAVQVNLLQPLASLTADASRVQRVFANLVDNAVKFTAPGGRVTIGAEPVSGGVRFSVANSGPALAREQLDAMFEPFWQVGRDTRGAGLGLSICRSIVEAHGGSIWAEPAEGERVRICFVLPRAARPHDGKSELRPVASPRAADLPGARVAGRPQRTTGAPHHE